MSPPTTPYPTGFKLVATLLGLCLAVFMVALDTVIIVTAIPRISSDFNSLRDVGWYGIAYFLAITIFQPIYGQLYRYFNLKRWFLISAAIFEVGSIICAAAPSSPVFIVGRLVAGGGAAGIFQGGFNIVSSVAPLHRRPAYIGLIGSMYAVANCVGPVAGGALTDGRLTWRFCFWVNLPIGFLSFLAVTIFYRQAKSSVPNPFTVKERLARIDYKGSIVLAGAATCGLLALYWGGNQYSWSSSRVIGLFVGCGLLTVFFIVVEWKTGDLATIPPSIFMKRSIFGAAFYSFFCLGASTAQRYYLPIYFQAIKNVSAETSGIWNMPYPVATILTSVIAGVGTTKLGYYSPFMILGAILLPVSSGLIHTLDKDSPLREWFGYQVFSGLAIGLGQQLSVTVAQTVLDDHDSLTGTAIMMFFQQLGAAISVAIAQSIFTETLRNDVPKFSSGVNGQAIVDAGATNFRSLVPANQLPGIVKAYTLAIQKAFILSIVLGCLCLVSCVFIEWKSVKGKQSGGDEAEAEEQPAAESTTEETTHEKKPDV